MHSSITLHCSSDLVSWRTLSKNKKNINKIIISSVS